MPVRSTERLFHGYLRQGGGSARYRASGFQGRGAGHGMSHAIDLVVSAILALAGLVMAAAGIVDGFLVTAMSAVGLPPLLQLLILIAVALWVVMAALRLLGGAFALLLLILFMLLLVHWVMPGSASGQWHHALPPLRIPGAIRI
jgi:hypothetical protein